MAPVAHQHRTARAGRDGGLRPPEGAAISSRLGTRLMTQDEEINSPMRSVP